MQNDKITPTLKPKCHHSSLLRLAPTVNRQLKSHSSSMHKLQTLSPVIASGSFSAISNQNPIVTAGT
ncbi:hypothetical protein HBI56_029160 [Parastagonospora nodorum]|uniref:Uncharacterized protein n=1 Tax=Phaeosphaeria nodorum (strain SN15 / ATCC MYA-4574 / FGSC 10173) TaxID=321614 RepID=A0A7U2F071_PHANO|nr:hypothetical protein HBH56_016780 [Parastagonospora nodorum]QRC95133.1 hypothetical protein JI435_301990 [Parastagonospora nodorum SN15]KAH3936815.1 hypothetical protein HBH54_017690 [Parastagonospora nodorum]KAH3953711.1 hypothetical protein HBH53_030060 [Parastagonospora nodorum]KAH3969178.1 hypothetical protein HBH51_122210 [Parastagonospora nodorum]